MTFPPLPQPKLVLDLVTPDLNKSRPTTASIITSVTISCTLFVFTVDFSWVVSRKYIYKITNKSYICTDKAKSTLGLPSPTMNPPIAVSSRDFQTSADRWTSAFLPTVYGQPTSPSVQSLYSSGLPCPSSAGLPLDALRHLQPALRRFSHNKIAHPTLRQPAFTVHHGPHPDLTIPGQAIYTVSQKRCHSAFLHNFGLR